MKRRDSRGFTLIELLGVIVIIGIISVISIVAVTRLINKSKSEQKESQKKTVEMAAESYLQANRNLLPKSIGETTIITINNLKEANYLKEDIKDGNGRSCMEKDNSGKDKSYVVVSKKSATKYTYKAYLYCGNDIVPAKEQIATPTINVKYYAVVDNVEINANSEENFLNKVSNPKYQITIEGGTSNGTNYTVDSYNYSISAEIDGKETEVYSSGTLSANKSAKVIIPGDTSAGTVSGDLRDYVDVTKTNNISIYVIARNSAGVTYAKKTSLDSHGSGSGSASYKDNEKPTCDRSSVQNEARDENDWINKSNYSGGNKRTITINCKDKGGSNCVRKKYTKTWPNSQKSSAEWDYIQVEDNAGNKSLANDPNCAVRVNIDLESPTITIDAYKNKTDTTSRFTNDVVKTSNSNVTVIGTQYKDLVNGWMNKTNYKDGIYYKVVVKDNLYLKDYEWKVNEPGQNSYGSDNSLKSNIADGVGKTAINATAGGEYTFYVSFTKDGKRKGKLIVHDRAGNEIVYSLSANIDRTPPDVPTVKFKTENNGVAYNPDYNNPNTNNEPWTNQNIITTPSVKADALSGFNRFECVYMKFGNTKVDEVYTKNNADAHKVVDSGRNTIKYRSMDNAGNYSDYSAIKRVYVDKIAPNVPRVTGYKDSVGANNVVASNTWIKGKNIVRGTGSSDGLSGIKSYKVRTTGAQVTALKDVGNKSYGEIIIDTKSQGITNVFYKACDNVGNCSNEAGVYIAKIDNKAPSKPTLTACLRKSKSGHTPSCSRTDLVATTKIANNKWYKGYVTVQALGSTDTESGFSNYVIKYKGAEKGTENYNSLSQDRINLDNDGVTIINVYACDKVGNCTSDSNVASFTAKMDNQAPPKPTVYGWKKETKDNPTSPSSRIVKGAYSSGEWYKYYTYITAGNSGNNTGTVGVDTTSGVYKKETSGFSHYQFTTTGATTNYTNKKGGSNNVEANGKSKVKYQACDKVGNCSDATEFSVNLDHKDPTCSAVKSNTWSTSGVTVTENCSDSDSGCANASSYPKKHTGVKGDFGTKVCDVAGNCSRCGAEVSKSYECDTCGGGAFDCSYRKYSPCDTPSSCVDKCGGQFRQTSSQAGHTELGYCLIRKTCYHPTYSCNCKYYYY